MKQQAHLPFPELLGGDRGRNWEVKEGEHGETSMLDPRRKRMVAPGDDIPCVDCGYPHSPAIRAHELMHARYSPVGTYKRDFIHRGIKRFVEDKYIHMAEETRIDYIGIQEWEAGRIRMWDEPEEYHPACGEGLKQALAHHLRRLEFRSAAEIIYLMQHAAPSGSPVRDMYDVIYSHLMSYFASILPKTARAAHTEELASLAVDYSMDTLLKQMDEWFPGIVTKMAPPQRKQLVKVVTGTGMLWNFNNYIRYSELKERKTPDELKKIKWNKVLRYAYVLQERFKEFSDNVDKTSIDMEDFIDEFAKGKEKKVAPTVTAMGETDPEKVVSDRRGLSPRRERYTRPVEGKADHEDLFGKLESPTIPISGVPKYGYKVDEAIWQGMRVTKARFDERYPEWKLQRAKARAREEGAIPRFMHRYASDKRVFAHKYKTPTVSVLVDDSGSMGMTAHQVKEIIEAAPGSIIGVYAGSDGERNTLGRLNVVAFNGQRASTKVGIDEFGGNGCDYPALEWLAEQPWPRIWFSDGGITTPFRAAGITKQVESLMTAAGIVRVRDMKSLKGIIDGTIKAPQPRHRYYKRNMKAKPDMLLTPRWKGRSQKGYADV